jgi:glycosyltransferase involved in cell wall biosynthesis
MAYFTRQLHGQFEPRASTREPLVARAIGWPRRRKVFIVGGDIEAMIRFRGPLIKELLSRGVDVVCAASPSDAGAERRLEALGARYVPIALARGNVTPIRDARALLALIRVLRRERPSVVLSYNMKPLVYATLAARLARVERRVAMIEGLGYAYTPGREWKRRFARIASDFLYAIPCALSHDLIVLNRDDRALIAGRFMQGREMNVRLMHGIGIDLDEFAPEPLPEGPLTFVMIARLLRDKGVYEFAEAARRLKAQQLDVRFVLLGKIESGSSAVRGEDVAAWVRDGRLDHVGDIADVRPWIRQSHVLVLPSYREGLPCAVMEAMAMGRPCIVTDVPGCRDVVAHHHNGLVVEVRSAGALADAATLFVRKRDLLGPWSRAAAQTAKHNFDASRQAVEMASMLHA